MEPTGEKLDLTDKITDVEPARNLNRHTDIKLNCAQVRREFVGKSEVCHQLAQHIIHLRRDIDVDYHWREFEYIIHTHWPILEQELDVRWLLSCADTIVDHGTIEQSGIAMSMTMCINSINILYTGLLMCGSAKLNPHLGQKKPTWGGMITADLYDGDMMFNMMTRMNKVVDKDIMCAKIWHAIKHNSNSNDIPINAIASLNRDPQKQKYFI